MEPVGEMVKLLEFLSEHREVVYNRITTDEVIRDLETTSEAIENVPDKWKSKVAFSAYDITCAIPFHLLSDQRVLDARERVYKVIDSYSNIRARFADLPKVIEIMDHLVNILDIADIKK